MRAPWASRAWVGLLLVTCVLALPRDITIGGLFDSQDETLEIAFRYAVERVNSLRWLLPKSTLQMQIEHMSKDDSNHASKRVCSMLKSGVAAIFGPQSDMTGAHVQSICDTLEIPHIETRWDYRLQRDDYSVNLYPHPTTLSHVYAQLLERLNNWSNFAVLYENNEGLSRMQEVLKMARGTDSVVRQLEGGSDFRAVLRGIKDTHTRIVLDCSVDTLAVVLKQLQQVGMMNEHYEYIITNLDFQTLDLEDYQYGGMNITGFRLVDPTRQEVKTIVSEWRYNELRKRDRIVNITEKDLKTEAALMYDAVMLFASALTDLDLSKDIDIRPLSCDGDDAWVHGNSIINYMKLVQIHDQPQTLTGEIKFDPEGFRSNFVLDIVKLTEEGLKKIGTWSKPVKEKNGVNVTYDLGKSDAIAAAVEAGEVLSADNKSQKKKDKLVVVSHEGEPYFLKKKHHQTQEGNAVWEGYVPDLVDRIGNITGFQYELRAVRDGNYGSKNKDTGVWDGMIKDLLDMEADMVVADLTITSARGEAVDFTTPFLNLGISILFTKPTKEEPSLLAFLAPFSIEVWLYMSAAYIGVSFILFILARFSPHEWDNPYPCIQEPEVLENSFTVLNSLWFTIGSLMQQGSDVAPKAISTRLVAGMWWFFTLIIISSYTANLAAFLTAQPNAPQVDSAEALSRQTKVKYGCVAGGSTAKFFETHKLPVYERMWNFMAAHKSETFVKSNEEGVAKVLAGDYAFLMEDTNVDFVTNRQCTTHKVGGQLDQKGYGIAVRKNDPLREKLTAAILYLQEKEVLAQLKKKWWQEKGAGCPAEQSSGGASALSMKHVGGVFVVLLSGMGMSCLIAFAEFVWNVRNTVQENRSSMKSEMVKELQFVFKCSGSTKPVRKNPPETENGLIGYSGLTSKDT